MQLHNAHGEVIFLQIRGKYKHENFFDSNANIFS